MTFSQALWFWLAQAAVGIGIALALGLILGAILLWQTRAQWTCKHDAGVRETMACDAICEKCGKNLGFIGTWRERHRAASSEGEKK